MNRSVKTITLKLHNIGRDKKNIIDEAMTNYSKAFQYLLDAAACEIEDIRNRYKDSNGKYRAFNVKAWIDKELNEKLSSFSIEPFKDSLKIDFAAVISGYLNSLEDGREPGFPTAFISDDKFEYEYNKLMNDYIDDIGNSEQIEEKIRKLLELKDKIRPLFFCRYSTNRNYSLLYDPENNRYFAKIYLMNVKDEKRKVSLIQSSKALYYICKNNQAFEKSSRKNCFLLFPLSFGSYQEEYLKRALENPEILRTARLIKKKDEYFLSINIFENTENEIEPLNYMGISRGILSAVNYSIVDFNGNQLSEDSIETMERFVKDYELNRIANCLLKISKENKSQIIMENLLKISDRLSYEDKDGKICIPRLNCSNYNKLFDILNKKILSIGLPKIIRVSSRDIFYSCTICGSTSKHNRFTNNIIICTKCGMYSDIDKTGSLNLARKLIKYSNDKIKIIVEDTQNGVKFINTDLEFEFYPQNPYDCIDEFNIEIDKLIKSFYDNINIESKNINFMKKLSMIKKIEKNRKSFELIKNN